MSEHNTPSSRLLVLGATAVASIYAAGFQRTRDAARQLEEEDAAHARPPVATRPSASRPDLPRADTVRAAAALMGDSAAVAARTPDATAAKPAPKVPKKVAKSDAPAPVEAAAAAAVAAATVATANVDSSADSSSVAAPVAPPAPAPATTDSAAAVPAAKWRDGTYSGWGNSRHGSIEATVTVKAGRITDAFISRCLTRYSCSWIEHLQIQVVDRQGPEVDFVSGATQSVNAFYYAVVEALGKAKTP